MPRRSAVVFLNHTGAQLMNPTSQLIVRFTVSFVVGFTMAYASCWLLSIFLWGWLACILGMLISIAAACTETVQVGTARAGDLAVEGCASALNAFRGLRARFSV